MEQNKEQTSTEEDVVARAHVLETGIDSLHELEEWKVSTKQEIQHLRERVIAHLDAIQRRSLVIIENIYTEEKQMHLQNRQETKRMKRRGVCLEAVSNAMDASSENLDEVKECLDRLNLSNERRPALNNEMKTILKVVEYISSGKMDLNLDMIIGDLTKPENVVIENEQRSSHDFDSDFMEN